MYTVGVQVEISIKRVVDFAPDDPVEVALERTVSAGVKERRVNEVWLFCDAGGVGTATMRGGAIAGVERGIAGAEQGLAGVCTDGRRTPSLERQRKDAGRVSSQCAMHARLVGGQS